MQFVMIIANVNVANIPNGQKFLGRIPMNEFCGYCGASLDLTGKRYRCFYGCPEDNDNDNHIKLYEALKVLNK